MRQPRINYAGFLIVAGMALVQTMPVLAQSYDPKPTAGTQSPVPASPPTSSPTSQQSQPTSSPTRTQSSRTNSSGVKIDPVQAAKTIIDIFGKKRAPPQVQPTPTPQPAARATEPPVTTQAPQPAPQPINPPIIAQPAYPRTKVPVPKIIASPKKPVRTIAAPPSVQKVPAAMAKDPPIPAPLEPPPQSPKVAPAVSPSPRSPDTITVFQAEQPPAYAPSWPLVAALLALAATIAAATRYFLFPKARFDLEFETGSSQIVSSASPFAAVPEASFDIEFEWGWPSTPSLMLAPEAVRP